MESWPWTISICGVATRFQGSSSAPLVCRCVVMTIILSSSKGSLAPQSPTSHLREEAAPTGQEAINGLLFLGTFLFGVSIAACWCQCMTCQGLGHYAQLLDMRMRLHQEILYLVGLLILQPEQTLQHINQRCRVAALAQCPKVLVIASSAIITQ